MLRHEIRSLLESGRRSHNDIKSLFHSLGSLKFNTEVIQNLIKDLLDLSHMELSPFEFNQDCFDFLSVIKTAVDLISTLSSWKNIKIKGPSVIPGEKKFYKMLYGDQNRII